VSIGPVEWGSAGYLRRMRLADSFRSERFGAVRIHELQRVIELDSGGSVKPGSLAVAPDALRAAESQMVIVVPCMHETRGVIEGVLSGIPHDCLIVLVSNSDRSPVDRYEIEAQTVEQFCRLAGRSAITVHQRDPGVAGAFKLAGMPELLDDDGLVRAGKGEAMLIGMALAAMTGRRYVGYVDADLGLKLRLAGGFAVEPYEYLDMFEQFGGVLAGGDPEVTASSVPVLQIETRNPHFHDNKGVEHVQGMRAQALNVIYHSPVPLPAVRREIVDFLVAQGVLGIGEEPARERAYPPVGTLDLDLLYDALDAEALSFRQPDGRASIGLAPEPPVDRAAIPRKAA
jgi:Mannosyl-3-phosphoglycerate synthase (osmo_MPGsynth)